VAAALDGEAADVLRVEHHGIRREGCAARVLDALVDGKDRQIAGPAEAPGVEHALEVAEDAGLPVARDEDAVDIVGPGQRELVAPDALALVIEQAPRVGAEELGDAIHLHAHGRYFRTTRRNVNSAASSPARKPSS